MKKFITLFIVITVFLAGCGDGQVIPEAGPTPFPTPVRSTFTVERGDIVVETKLGGRVSPLALHTVYFAVDGQVREVYVTVNDFVKEGQLLGELDKAMELRANANVTQRAIRRAQIDVEIARLMLEQYETEERPQYEIEIQKLRVEQAQMDFDELMESMGIDPEAAVTDELAAQVAQAQAFAPAGGTVIAAVVTGRNVSPTTPAFVLGDPDKLEVIADLPAGDAEVREMFEGMPVTVIVDAKAGVEIKGTIRQLPSPYGTGVSEEHVARILLDTPPSADTYQLGDKVTVRVVLASKNGILWLPPDAVRATGGRTFVIINSDSGPKRVDVEIGLRTRDMIEIVSGLEEGQVVVGP